MTYALGNVIAQIGGAGVVREHTPLNVTVTQEGAAVWSGTIPAGHVLAVEITTNVMATGWVVVGATDESWGEMQALSPLDVPRLTLVTAPGHEGPVTVGVAATDTAFTVTGVTTTLIPT